jgi:outer membrane lipoprotein SlyB
MKKIFFLMAILFAFSVTSCKQSNEASAEAPVDPTAVQVDSTSTDTTSVDTAKVDTVKSI